MEKRTKVLLGVSAAAAAGVGAYAWVRAHQNRNGHDGAWTTADIPDLAGKVVIVTGANSGIGFESAKAFAAKGARTILACRNMEKAQTALVKIMAEVPGAQAEIMRLDLADLGSVRDFVATFRASYDRLDVLLNNAGIMMVPYGITVDGYERQLGTNHLGHFALTGQLIDLLCATPGSRVVNVSSLAHLSGEMAFDNFLYEGGRDYTPQAAYGRSKLANLLFTYELQRRLAAAGADAIAVAAHPGLSETNLFSHLVPSAALKIARPVMRLVVQDAAMGALPSLRAAADPNVVGGQYYGPAGAREFGGYPVVVPSNGASHDEAAARRLWEVSERLTGVHFDL